VEGTERNDVRVRPPTPPWVWWTLLVGSAILLAWSWFLLSFISEPSAVGRTRAILAGLAGSSIGAAVLGMAAAIGLWRDKRWAWRLGLVASVFMILTCAGAVAGIPAVFGLAGGRNSSKP
jgi:hypothetical protein